MFDYLIKKAFLKDAWPFDGGKDSVLAIDVSHSTVALMEMSRRPEGYVLESYDTEILPIQGPLTFMADPGRARGTERTTDRETFESIFPDFLVFALKSLIERSQCSLASRRSVVIGLSGPSVIARWLRLDEHGAGDSGFNSGLEDIQEIEDQVALIYEHIIPFPIEESYYDYQLGCHESNSKTFGHHQAFSKKSHKKCSYQKSRSLKEILIAASPRNQIEPWIELMDELNLKLEMITLSSLSIHAALDFICESSNIFALELQKNHSTLYVFQADRLLLSRDFPVELGAIHPPFERGAEGLLSELCDQIKIAASQCSIEQKNEEQKHWILFGDNILVQSLKEKIEQNLQISMTIANPFSNAYLQPLKAIKFSEKISGEEREAIQDKASMLILAFGLAQSCLINRKSIDTNKKINLLPWRAAEKKARNQAFYAALGFMVCLALFSVLGIWAYFYHQKIKTDQLASQLVSEKNQLHERAQAIEAFKKDQYRAFKDSKLIETLEKDRLRWVQFFNVLPTLLPEGLFLTSLIGKGETLTVEGNARTHCAVAALLKTLSELKDPCFFKDIQLTEITTDKQEMGLKFKLQFKIPS